MYKGSNERQSFVGRTGSHATKPHGTGRIDHVPPWAEEPEAYYNDVRDRYRSLADQLRKAQDQLTEINFRLRTSLPYREYQHLREQRDRIAALHSALQNEASNYRALARAAGEKSWAIVFVAVAKKILSRETFVDLCNETTGVLGRRDFEIARGDAEMSPEQKARSRAKEARQKRRHDFRARRGGDAVVWRDD